MPYKDGRLTPKEIRFADAYARLGDRAAAEREAGLPATYSYQVLRRPEVQAEIVARENARLADEGLPLAVDTILRIMRDEKAPPNAKLKAAGMVLDRFPEVRDALGRDPVDMSSEELAQAISALEVVAAGKAINVTPTQPEVVEADPFA